MKIMLERRGKPKTTDLKKLKKKMHGEFLPGNYGRALYWKLQNHRQGSDLADDYFAKFYELSVKKGLAESQDQLVSRYIRGLC